ncbi:M48 family metalloprotease [Camelliibacillus cellulosilyticus]|uniref:M48 family metalloprotease n=1 Tax=Camelliibacillus cellulosilyticus TaxID=2174486 RepID=A0ABV9GP39_9BACL
MEKCEIKNAKLYLWETKKSKLANALVTGLRTKRIFIADYVIDQLTKKQIKAILAHEIGHIKRNHLWTRLGFMIVFFLIIYGLDAGYGWFQVHIVSMPQWLGVLLIVLLGITFFILLFLFIRIQERQADDYVLKLGVDYRDYASALIKLARLNHTLTKMNKVEESFKTHPSIDRRVRRLIEKANGSYEELAVYQAVDQTQTIE